MGFFKDFKDDLSEATNEIDENEMTEDFEEDQMVNTFDNETENSNLVEENPVNDNIMIPTEEYTETAAEREEDAEEEDDDDGITPVDETAVITAGLKVNGDFDSVGSIDVFGVITGNIKCRGKLTVSGTINGSSEAGEVFANDAKIEGNIVARGAVKIGQNTVVLGNINGTSAVIAGAVKGDIDVQGPVIIDSSAIVSGDIKSKTVQINNGATIDGRCTQCYANIDMDAVFNLK